MNLFLKDFFGGCEDNRKIAWINWESICTPKEDRGLGVKRVGAFNLSLLEKWCWRMLVEKEGLWYRVLKAQYGEEGGRLKDGGSRCSVWWREMCGVREGLGEGVGRWFDDNTCCIVGDGRDALFWHDIWVGEIPLKFKFSRLYELVENKECSVAEAMRVIGDGRGCGVVDCWLGMRRV